eukprot:scaffold5211_cov30-Phaeocystis_antarctica.AAC.1
MSSGSCLPLPRTHMAAIACSTRCGSPALGQKHLLTERRLFPPEVFAQLPNLGEDAHANIS